MKYIKDIDFTYKKSDLRAIVGRTVDFETGNYSYSLEFSRNPTGLYNYNEQFWQRTKFGGYISRTTNKFTCVITIESMEGYKLVLEPMVITDIVNQCKLNKYPMNTEDEIGEHFIRNQVQNNEWIKNKEEFRMMIAIYIEPATPADLLYIYLTNRLGITKDKATMISKAIPNIKKEHTNSYLQKSFDLDDIDRALILQYIENHDMI